LKTILFVLALIATSYDPDTIEAKKDCHTVTYKQI